MTTTEIEERAPLSLVVAGNVRAELARAGITGKSLAKTMGMSQAAVSARVRGTTPWTVDEIEVVARILRMTTSNLLVRPEGFEPPTFWSVVSRAALSARAFVALSCREGQHGGQCVMSCECYCHGERLAWELAA